MKLSCYIVAITISTMTSSVMAEGQPILGKISQEQKERYIKGQNAAPLGTWGPPQKSTSALPDAAACEVATVRRDGKVTDIYWTNGPHKTRVTTDVVDHYVDLNLVVRTVGYENGDCIEVRIKTDDGENVAVGTKEIVLRGRVNENGITHFKEPLKTVTVLLFPED